MLQNQSSKTEILHMFLRVGMRIIKGVLDKQRSGDTGDCRLAVTTATMLLKTTPSDAEKINLSKDTR